MQEFTADAGTLATGLIGGLFLLGALLSKFRTIWTRDSADVAVNNAQVVVVEMLRDENKRLHEQVQQLQQEVAKLQMIVSNLTTKLTQFEITKDQQSQLDQLAREGKLDRRIKRN